jgi:hypothetical protein
MTPADIRLMTVPDKIRLMEALWQDLSEGNEVVESPDWHAAVLAERVSRLASGQDTFIDWAVAKKLLREECDQTIRVAARQSGSIRDEMQPPLKGKGRFLSICAQVSSGPSGCQNGLPAAILGRKMESACRFDRYRRSFLSTRPHHPAQSLGLRAFPKDCPAATFTVRSSSTA